MGNRLLRVVSHYFVAGAIWEKTDDQWKCIRAAPIIKWMVGKSPEFVADYIKKKKWDYQWL